jgi:diaminopimelate epimerase
MGPPAFAPADVPVVHDGPHALDVKVDLGDDVLVAACLSMGNPHAVVFVDEPDDVALEDIGPRLEHHPLFPARTNVEFAVVEDPERVRMRVWERGSGQTLACGTGACAVAVAARLLRGAAPRVTVVLPGGELEVAWDGSLERSAPVWLTGPAVRSFAGELDLEAYR